MTLGFTLLCLNLDKTEVIIFGPKHLRNILADHIITLDDFLQSSCLRLPFSSSFTQSAGSPPQAWMFTR